MIQQSLFPGIKTESEKAKENLERVRSRIERTIMEFFKACDPGTEFHAEDLCAYVNAKGITCAPDSPGRIMRVLRKEQVIHYVVASRKESLYRVTRQ